MNLNSKLFMGYPILVIVIAGLVISLFSSADRVRLLERIAMIENNTVLLQQQSVESQELLTENIKTHNERGNITQQQLEQFLIKIDNDTDEIKRALNITTTNS